MSTTYKYILTVPVRFFAFLSKFGIKVDMSVNMSRRKAVHYYALYQAKAKDV